MIDWQQQHTVAARVLCVCVYIKRYKKPSKCLLVFTGASGALNDVQRTGTHKTAEPNEP